MIQKLSCGDKALDLSGGTLIMGVLNVTPDSFSDGGEYLAPDVAIVRAKQLQDQGADIIDIGGESSRPGSERISAQQELDRVLPVLEVLTKELEVPVSIDTYRTAVAEPALAAGVAMINDISALRFDADMAALAAEYGVPLVLMHMQGEPKTMQEHPTYDDVVAEIREFLENQVSVALAAGVQKEAIVVDPGIGFGKRVRDNYEILRRLREFLSLEVPLLVGPSRKAFIGAVTGLGPGERLEGTLAAVTACVLNGAHIVRVHDVTQAKRAVMVADAIAGKR